MTDKQHLIDAYKMLEWMSGINIGFTEKFEEQLRAKIFVKDFDPDPPQQPDIQVGERNWQEDMNAVNAFKHARSCVNIPKYQTMPSIETPYEPLEYWLQQYAELQREYERFQQVAKGWNDDLTAAEKAYEGLQANCVSRGEYEATLKKLDDMTKAYHALLPNEVDV